MNVSTLSFFVFVVILILLEILGKDTNVLVICWVLIWSISVYLLNDRSFNDFFKTKEKEACAKIEKSNDKSVAAKSQ